LAGVISATNGAGDAPGSMEKDVGETVSEKSGVGGEVPTLEEAVEHPARKKAPNGSIDSSVAAIHALGRRNLIVGLGSLTRKFNLNCAPLARTVPLGVFWCRFGG